MTNEILDRANALKRNIKHMSEILDVLNADGLEISIAANINGINRRNTWIWQGENRECIEVKEALIRTFSKRLSEYIAEFNAL